MKVLIVGCGWVGTYTATNMMAEGHKIWATCTATEKVKQLQQLGFTAQVADFDREDRIGELGEQVFDVVVISVPITRKDSMEVVNARFTQLVTFLQRLTFKQSFFFGSVGVYPKVSVTIDEDTFGDATLDPKLFLGESMLRMAFPDVNVLRLGGLFGFERIMAKYFVDKVCEIGYQTANFIHVEDIYGIICAMIAYQSQGKTYNVVCPEHPLKKDVIEVSAAKYGFGLPSAFTETDKTAKEVSPERLIMELRYRFRYPSPLQF